MCPISQRLAAWRSNGNERATRGGPPVQPSRLVRHRVRRCRLHALGQVFGFGVRRAPQAQRPPAQHDQAASRRSSRKRFNRRAQPLPPAGPSLATSAPLPPPRPADLGRRSPAQQIQPLPRWSVSAVPMPSRAPVTPTPSPVPNRDAARRRHLDPGESAARLDPGEGRRQRGLQATAWIPVQLPAASAQPAAQGPWTKYQTGAAVAARAGHPEPVGVLDVGRRQTLASTSKAPAKPGASAPPRKAHGRSIRPPSRRSRRRSPGSTWGAENNNAPWLDFPAAKPEPTVGAFHRPLREQLTRRRKARRRTR